MRKISFVTYLLAILSLTSCVKTRYDVIVYGCTSSGVMAAYSASMMGADVLLIGPDITVGGMTTGGLGATDIGNKQAITGLARQFYRKLGTYYGELEKWTFEPHVAQEILEGYLDEENITVIKCSYLESVIKNGTKLESITCSGKSYTAKQFIDCSYEGDLMAAAGVSYRTGREDNKEYSEDYNGSQIMNGHQFIDGVDPFVEQGNPDSGLLWGISNQTLKDNGTGDNLIQAYNFRICLTDDPSNRIDITRPDGYDSTFYQLFLRIQEKQPWKVHLKDWFIWSLMPNHKTDINNCGPFSTDMIGMNYGYPEGDWKVRDSIINAHKIYTMGLLYFIGHDTRVPEELRSEMLKWGLPKDEYVETGHWTPQLYIREARRMQGEYVASQADCQSKVSVTDGIAMAAYTMDSHNCERIVTEKDGILMVKNEGNVEIFGGKPYPVSYRSITPKREECTNLLVPVCLSATHIAYGSIRMEPVFMETGQAAGIAACLALKTEDNSVQNVPVDKIQNILKENPCLDGSAADLVVDDNDSKSVHSKGWVYSNPREAYGPSLLKLSSGNQEAELVYSFPKSVSGKYELYVYQVAGDYTGITDYEIQNGNEKNILTFEREKHAGLIGGEWVNIGSVELDAENETQIKVLPKPDGKTAVSDAILLVKK